MDRQSAISQVLGTPELVEMILLDLDMHTILVSAQRVNKTWNAVVAGSIALQRYIFLAPDYEPLGGPDEFFWPFTNLLLERYFHEYIAPLRDISYGSSFAGMREWAFYPREAYKLGKPKPITNATAYPEFARSKSSWRRMLINQRPPVRTVQIVMNASHEYLRKRTFHFPRGLTMGNLYGLLTRFKNKEDDGWLDENGDPRRFHTYCVGWYPYLKGKEGVENVRPHRLYDI